MDFGFGFGGFGVFPGPSAQSLHMILQIRLYYSTTLLASFMPFCALLFIFYKKPMKKLGSKVRIVGVGLRRAPANNTSRRWWRTCGGGIRILPLLG